MEKHFVRTSGNFDYFRFGEKQSKAIIPDSSDKEIKLFIARQKEARGNILNTFEIEKNNDPEKSDELEFLRKRL